MSLKEIQRLLASPDEEVRRSALQALASFPAADMHLLLFGAMGDHSWRVRKEAVELFVAAPPHEGDIDALIDLLRDQDNAGLRNSAAEAIVRQGKYAQESLIRRATDPDPELRKFIIDVMGAIGNRAFIPALLHALNDADVNVAAAAAEHLGAIGESSVLTDLLRAIVSNEAVLFRFSALAALAALASPAPVPEEIKRLADQDILRKAVFDCLGSIGSSDAAPLLVQGMGDRQKSVRIAALKALYRISCRIAPEERESLALDIRRAVDAAYMERLLELYDNYDSQLLEALVWVSGLSTSPAGIDVLIRAFVDDRISVKVLECLRARGSEGVEQLMGRFDLADEVQRETICTLLGELGGGRGAVLLRRALADHAPAVRKAAAVAIGKLGLAECIPALVDLIEDADVAVRVAVIASLKVLALIDREAVAQVARRLSDSAETEQRRNAALLLAALGDGERLMLLIKDESPLVRQAAIEAIGKLQIASSGSLLIMALVDEEPDVRIAAAEALGELGDAGTLAALESALNDDDIWVRAAALKSIAAVAPDRVFAIVARLCGHAEGLLAITCIDVLAIEGSSAAVQLVQRFLSAADQDISRHAAAVLERLTASRGKGGA